MVARNSTIERHREEYTGISQNKIALTRIREPINYHVNSP